MGEIVGSEGTRRESESQVTVVTVTVEASAHESGSKIWE